MRILFRDFEKLEYLIVDQNYNIIEIFTSYDMALDFLQLKAA